MQQYCHIECKNASKQQSMGFSKVLFQLTSCVFSMKKILYYTWSELSSCSLCKLQFALRATVVLFLIKFVYLIDKHLTLNEEKDKRLCFVIFKVTIKVPPWTTRTRESAMSQGILLYAREIACPNQDLNWRLRRGSLVCRYATIWIN